MNANIIPNVHIGGYDLQNCWPYSLTSVPSYESAAVLVSKLRTRLAEVDRQLQNVTSLESERAAILRMLEAYDGK